MLIAYANESAISANKILDVYDGDVRIVQSSHDKVDVNWGRRFANSDLNPDISNAVNKRVMRRLFAENAVPSPRLYNANSVRINLMLSTDRKFVGRPDYHSRGRGFWLISTVQELGEALRGTPNKAAATHFMEYIPKDKAPREYRAHVFKGQSIRISEKQFDENGEYKTVAPTHSVYHVREVAKKAVAATGLDFGAVDIIANDAECWALEVNAAPGLGGTMPVVYAETFRRWKEQRDV